MQFLVNPPKKGFLSAAIMLSRHCLVAASSQSSAVFQIPHWPWAVSSLAHMTSISRQHSAKNYPWLHCRGGGDGGGAARRRRWRRRRHRHLQLENLNCDPQGKISNTITNLYTHIQGQWHLMHKGEHLRTQLIGLKFGKGRFCAPKFWPQFISLAPNF